MGPNDTLQPIAPVDRWLFDPQGNMVGAKNPRGTGDDFRPVSSPVRDAITATGSLPANALNAITPYNSSSGGVLTLPPAAAAWASSPYGLVVVSQKGTGAASFAAGGSDTLRATSGIATSSVQYGMIAAQIISATEWALA